MTSSVWGTSKRLTLSALLVLVSSLAIARTAQARPVTAMWDPNDDPFTVGYRIFVGTASGAYTFQVDVGNTTSYHFEVPDLPRLYFVVRAYNADGVLGPPSNEVVIGSANRPPVLFNPGDFVAPPGPISAQLPAHDPDGEPLTFSATGLPNTLSIDPATGRVSGYLPPGAYVITITASDGQDLTSVTFRLSVPGAGCVSAPASPVLQPATVNGNQVGLRWSSPAGSGPSTYTLVVGTVPGGSDIVVAELPASVTAIAPTAPNGQYFVRVVARNVCGAAVSNEISFRVGPTPPGPPSLSVQRSGSTVTLRWTQPAGGATAYVLEAGSAPGASNLAAYNTRSPLTSVTVNLQSGRYYVRVRAVNAAGVGAPSNEVIIRIP